VTIPANTIIQAGEYYVLSGQNILNQNCGNIDSAVAVDLNWTTCNCTNVPIPTTGDGFMANGGGSNEKVVLLNPNLAVIDAVSRSSTPSSSVSITTSSAGGGCTPRTFNLSTMSIAYEAINTATGIDNSYARRVDGDCGWVKTTDISANGPNKTGSTSSATYNFSTLNASQCNGSTGSISIGVSASDLASLFPMSYTIAYDADSNGVYNNADQYTFGVDSSSPSIDINNLYYGRYRITVGSSSGCNLKSFDFFIFNCYGVLLNSKLLSLQLLGESAEQYQFNYRANADDFKGVYLEGGDGQTFQTVATLNLSESFVKVPRTKTTHFRLRAIDDKNVVHYSKQVRIHHARFDQINIWPNPTISELNVRFASAYFATGFYRIYNTRGEQLTQETLQFNQGTNIIRIATGDLKQGLYQLVIQNDNGEMTNYRFMKR
jgi:hypothetical protein